MSANVNQMVLSEYYASLSESAKKELRENFLEKTGLSLPTFYYKLRVGSWAMMEQRVIAKYVGRKPEDIIFK